METSCATGYGAKCVTNTTDGLGIQRYQPHWHTCASKPPVKPKTMSQSDKVNYVTKPFKMCFKILSTFLALGMFCIQIYNVVMSLVFFILIQLVLVLAFGLPGFSFTIIYVLFCLIDWNASKNGRHLKCIDWYWSVVLPYFPLVVESTAQIPHDRNYLIGVHPHGIAAFASYSLHDYPKYQEMFGANMRHKLGMASFHFKIPLLREFCVYLCRGVDVGRETVIHNLSQPNGTCTLSIIIGGAREVLYTDPTATAHRLYLKTRKGFCKVALETGASLIPSYAFGETKIVRFVWGKETYWARKMAHFFYNKLGTALILSKPTPKNVPVTLVLGQPIHVTRTEKPTREQVDQLHAKYVEALTWLFESNKEKYILHNALSAHLEIL